MTCQRLCRDKDHSLDESHFIGNRAYGGIIHKLDEANPNPLGLWEFRGKFSKQREL